MHTVNSTTYCDVMGSALTIASLQANDPAYMPHGNNWAILDYAGEILDFFSASDIREICSESGAPMLVGGVNRHPINW